MIRISGVSLLALTVLLGSILPLEARVGRETENQYNQKYKNKAMFLKVPVRGMRQAVLVTDSGPVLDRANIHQPLTFKVGDQVRIVDLDFSREYIRFKIAAVDLSREAEIEFRFGTQLSSEFPQRAAFDTSLEASFTEGISYTEVDSARDEFIQGQFEQLIQQFATATGSSREFVIKSISERNPDYRAAQAAAAEARSRLQASEQNLRQETQARRQLENDMAELRREMNQDRSSVETLTRERNRLDGQARDLQQQVQQLTAQNRELEQRRREYENQVNGLIRNLGVETADRERLGERVEALSKSIDALQNERNELAKKLETVQAENQNLTQDLRTTQEARAKLQEEQRLLTSDRTSLNAQFLETRRQKESLETAAALSRALRLEDRLERRDEGLFQISRVYLGQRQIGTLEIAVPSRSDRIYPVRFSLNSPDTVQFTDEERALYSALGEKLQIETSWLSASPELTPRLLTGEASRLVAPRETQEWSWVFRGDLPEPIPVELQAVITDVNGEKIRLAPRQFVVQSSHLTARLAESFSVTSALGGALLGVLAVGLIVGVRGRSSSRQPKQPSRPAETRASSLPPRPAPQPPEEYRDRVIQKKL